MQKQVLNNGLVVYYYPTDSTYSTTIGLYIKTGSKYEDINNNGITHLLEHMHFRHLEELTQRELYFEMDKIGANLRATTYKEMLKFYLKCRPEFFEKALQFFSKIITMNSWNEDDLSSEKQVVLNELFAKSNYVCADQLVDSLIWRDHPLSMSILGTESTINSITLKQLIEYKKNVFSVNNMVILISGYVNASMIEYVKKNLGAFWINDCFRNNNRKELLSHWNKRGPDINTQYYEWEYVDLHLSFDIPDQVKKQELTLLNSILGGGTGAKLQAILREELGLTSDIYSYEDLYDEVSLLRISMTVHKDKICDSIEAIVDILNDLKHNITENDMLTNLPYYTSNLWYDLEDSAVLNEKIGWNIFNETNMYTVEQRIYEYTQISKDRLQQLSNMIFNCNNLCISVIGSVDAKIKESLLKITKKLGTCN